MTIHKILFFLFVILFINNISCISFEHSKLKYDYIETTLRNGYTFNPSDWKINSINDLWSFFYGLKDLLPVVQSITKSQESSVEPQPIAWNFIPFTKGRVLMNNSFSWEDPCFDSITASILSLNETICSLNITTGNKKDALCTSFYNMNTREKGFFLELSRSSHTYIRNEDIVQYEYNDIQTRGWAIFYWPLGIAGTIESIINTVLLFGSPDMEERNVDFFAHNMQWAMKERYAGFVNVSASEISSGTHLAVLRLDGLDPLTGWGTGGYTGHATVALWFDDDDNDGNKHGIEDEDDLYIVESIGKEDYWPDWGWIKTPWYQWQAQAINAQYHVAMMKLAPEYQELFNEQDAIAWFNQWEGTQYGIQSFIFIFIDTSLYNLPYPVTPELFTTLACFAERIIPSELNISVKTLLIEGYNHRLNSTCNDLHCIFDIIDPMHIDLIGLTTWPEQDSWMYDGHPSLTCASFVTGLFKSAGIFSAINEDINASEQSPKDLYQMALWDPYWKLPQGCKQADPALPYCQFLGDYSLILPGWNSLIPYANMNENCPSKSPLFYRPAIC